MARTKSPSEEAEDYIVNVIANGDKERAERFKRVARIVDAHYVKCPHSELTVKEVLDGMLSCPNLRAFAKAQKERT